MRFLYTTITFQGCFRADEVSFSLFVKRLGDFNIYKRNILCVKGYRIDIPINKMHRVGCGLKIIRILTKLLRYGSRSDCSDHIYLILVLFYIHSWVYVDGVHVIYLLLLQ